MNEDNILAEILECDANDIVKAAIEMKALLTSQPVAVTLVFHPINGQLMNVGITPKPSPIMTTKIVPNVLRQVAAMLEAAEDGNTTGIGPNSP